MFAQRLPLYQQLEENLSTKLLVYITGDRKGLETQIAQDAIDIFIEHLDGIGSVPKISLYLYTRGGNIAAAWNIINLLRIFCDELQVIVPHKAHSAGTLISLGAHSIIMTKQATLGPIDPSINTLLNPPIPGQMGTFPVSVEAVKGYLAFAREELLIKDDIALANVLIKLSDTVHPLVLGEVYRSRAQIKMLAEKLLSAQVDDKDRMSQIIEFLCSDSGSHDYTINRREAKDILGLNIIKPDDDLYKLIQLIYTDIAKELELGLSADLNAIAQNKQGKIEFRRGLIESINNGSHAFTTLGDLSLIQVDPTQTAAQLIKVFEGWKHEPTKNAHISGDSNQSTNEAPDSTG